MENDQLQRIIQRGVAVSKLKTRTIREIAHDPRATTEAMIVVMAVAMAAGLGQVATGGRGLFGGIIASLIGWAVAAVVTWWVGTNITSKDSAGDPSIETLLRTLGYATAPGILLVFAFLPFIGWIPEMIVSLWMLVTTVLAIRAAFRITIVRALLTAIVARTAAAVLTWLIYHLFGIPIIFLS